MVKKDQCAETEEDAPQLLLSETGIAGKKQRFFAFDGPHEAEIENENIRLQMTDVTTITKVKGNYFINTGSPHYVMFCKECQ